MIVWPAVKDKKESPQSWLSTYFNLWLSLLRGALHVRLLVDCPSRGTAVQNPGDFAGRLEVFMLKSTHPPSFPVCLHQRRRGSASTRPARRHAATTARSTRHALIGDA